MSDTKPLASLSSSLLARKGHAAPAMRRQAIQASDRMPHNLDDLGWNDMGSERSEDQFDSDPAIFPGAEPQPQDVPPVVHTHLDTIEREFSVPQDQDDHLVHIPGYGASGLSPMDRPVARTMRRAAPGSKGKSAFTLRLDGERHLQLRLVCAMKHRSAQQIVTEALDAFLARQPEVADLKRQAR
jgi:hypothetical protein